MSSRDGGVLTSRRRGGRRQRRRLRRLRSRVSDLRLLARIGRQVFARVADDDELRQTICSGGEKKTAEQKVGLRKDCRRVTYPHRPVPDGTQSVPRRRYSRVRNTHRQHGVDFSSFLHGGQLCLCLSRRDSVLHPERFEHGLEFVLRCHPSDELVPLPFRFLRPVEDEAGENSVLEEFERAVKEDAEICVWSEVHGQAGIGIDLADEGPRVTVGGAGEW